MTPSFPLKKVCIKPGTVHLYPASLTREILVLAWTDAENGATLVMMRDNQLATFTEPGDWTCMVVRAVYEDEGVREFNAQYERSNFPAELLWGPGRPSEAREWLDEAQPQPDSADYLDRLFALRIHGGRASLAMRPEIAIALPPERRGGTWYIVRADFPNDAFVHVRHIKDERICGATKSAFPESQPAKVATRPPIPSCAVEEKFKGGWGEMVDVLARDFSVSEPAELSTARVKPRFGLDVAPDVEAD